jgi:hypothetical protein
LAQDNNFQPFAAHIRRVSEALDQLGEPFSEKDLSTLRETTASSGGTEAVEKITRLLDSRCLFNVEINPEMRVKVARGSAKAELVEGGWRLFLVKVQNSAGTTAPLRASSPQGGKAFRETRKTSGAAGRQPRTRCRSNSAGLICKSSMVSRFQRR